MRVVGYPRNVRAAVVIESLESRIVLATTLPAGFEETLVVTGLDTPTSQVFAPDGRLFVAEKGGKIRIVEDDGDLRVAPFLTLPVDTFFENGIHGITLDPNFETNGYVYVYYTRQDAGAIRQRLSRFTTDPSNPNQGLTNSEAVLLDNITQTATSHQGGGLHFGADGMLYLTTGDGRNSANAQDLTSLMGKVLRLNVANYPNSIIPADNPIFPNAPANARPEIWAYGFRNLFTAGMKPGTSTLYGNDVGEANWEEINLIQKGKNYGWPSAEGMSTNSNFTNPIYAYPHGNFGAAITGGAFYMASQFPATYHGQYFFADYVQGFIRTLDPDNGNAVTNFATGARFPLDFDIGPDGSLYYLSGSSFELDREFPDSSIYKITYVGGSNRAPNAVASATPTSGLAPLAVQFSGNGSSDPDNDALTYTWDFGDGTTGQGQNVSHTYTEQTGTFQARLTVNDGRGGEDQSDLITITLGNRAPTGSITSPAVDTLYSGGQTIAFGGSATDPEDGTLPDSAFEWAVVFHHNTHSHPFIPSIKGVKSGTFEIPRTGETADDVFYRIHLTVTDANGLQHRSFRDVQPRKATVTLATNYPGLKINLDGQPQTAPISFVGVVGITRSLGAPDTQTLDGKTYEFVSWSDGGAATHSVDTPASNTTYTAVYREVLGTGPSVAISTIADAWVRDGSFAAENHGFDNELLTKKSSTNYNRDAYLKFDLSGVEASSITSVKLRIFARLENTRGTNAGLGVYGVSNTTWTEGNLPWNNKPAASTGVLASVVVPNTLARWFELDVTSWVRQQRQAGAMLVTLLLRNTTSVTPSTVINAREQGINRPEILITRTTTDPDPEPDPDPNPDPGAQVTLAAADDAYVKDGSAASSNFGLATDLQVKKSSPGYNRESYLRFNLSGVGPTISSAKLRLFGKLSANATAVVTQVYGAGTASWGEGSINWNNRPPVTTSVLAQQSVGGTAGAWYEFDVTSYLQQQKTAGATSVTLVLRNASGNSSFTIFNSAEATSNPPQLVIDQPQEPGPASPEISVSASSLIVDEGGQKSFDVQLTAAPQGDVTVSVARRAGGDEDLGATPMTLVFTAANWNVPQQVSIAAAEDDDVLNGTATFDVSASGMITRAVVVTETDNDIVPGATVTRNPSADAFVKDGAAAGTNFGTAGQLEVKKSSTGYNRESYLTFDLAGLSAISSAKLRLFGKLSASATAVTTQVFGASAQAWAESSLTWNTRPPAVTGPLAGQSVATTAGQWYEFDVTAFLEQQRAQGATSVTLILRNTTGNSSFTIFNSREAATNPPELVIEQ